MASISSLGVGSGLDAESIISSLMAVERKPVTLIQTEITSIKSQVSAIGKLKSLASTMGDKAEALAGIDLWNRKSVSNGDSSVVTATASSSAAVGSYALSVQALAARQTVSSAALGAVSEGTLRIELGSWTGSPTTTGFSAKSGTTAVDIEIGAGETSLSAVRDKINAAGAGVTASLVTDANGTRLALSSTETGAANAFRITATETTDDGDVDTGLSALAYTATASSPMTRNQTAANAQATVNGIEVESATNSFTGVIEGLDFSVLKTSSSDVALTVGQDTDSIRTAITDFVKAFNDLAGSIRDQTKYDATAKTAGALQGDRTTIALQWQLRSVLNEASTASSTWGRLSEIGLTMKQDGTLATSSSKLEDALADPTELRKLLATDADTRGASGFMDRFRDLADLVTGTDGSLSNRETALNDSVTRNQKRADQLEDRLTLTEKRLRAQYEALDTSMASLSALSSYVSQQFGSSSS